MGTKKKELPPFDERCVARLDELIRVVDAHLMARHGSRLDRLVAAAKGRDPALHRGDELELFRSHHENDYSNWLAWLFSEKGSQAALLQPALLAALSVTLPKGARVRLEREAPLRYEHKDGSGRIDLLMTREDGPPIVVEFKTRDPAAGELKKNEDYLAQVKIAYGEAHGPPIGRLVVPDPDEVEDGYGFEVIGWKRVVVSLRQVLRSTTEQKGESWRALLVLFVAAVERFVLGYPVDGWRKLVESGDRSGIRGLLRSPYVEVLEESYGITDTH